MVARWETSDRSDASVGLDAGFLDHFRPARLFSGDERAERFRRSGAHLGALFRQELLHVAGIQDPGQLGVEFRYDRAGSARRAGREPSAPGRGRCRGPGESADFWFGSLFGMLSPEMLPRYSFIL